MTYIKPYLSRGICLVTLILLAGCGYKGSLYLPNQQDKAQFGIIQSGVNITPPQDTLPLKHIKEEK